MPKNVFMIKEAILSLMEEKKLLSPRKEWLIILFLCFTEDLLANTHGLLKSDLKLKILTNLHNNSLLLFSKNLSWVKQVLVHQLKLFALQFLQSESQSP